MDISVIVSQANTLYDMRKTHRFNARLTTEAQELLERLSTELGVSKTAVVELVLRHYGRTIHPDTAD